MSTHKKILTITGAIISLALLLALPWLGNIKSGLYSILANAFPVPPVITLDDGNTYWDQFGYDVDTDGDYAIVGAPDGGAAYVFYKDPATGWGLQKEIITGAGYFGNSVGIDAVNGRAIVGAWQYNNGSGQYGAVYIYEKNLYGENNWGERAKIVNPYNNGEFGFSVDIDGDYAVVGNYSYNSYKGQAYVLKKNHPDTDNWGIYQTLDWSGRSNYSFLGFSVAISGDNIIVGEFASSAMQYEAGKAYIYHKDYPCPGSDCWGGINNPMNVFYGAYYNHLGYSVAIDGDWAIAGAPVYSNAYIFHYISGGDYWTDDAIIHISGEEELGKAISIKHAGTRVYAAIGSINGNVYMYSRDESGSWNKEYRVSDNFQSNNGGGIAISDKYVMYGNSVVNNDGAAYLSEYIEATCGNSVPEGPETCDDGKHCSDGITACTSDQDCIGMIGDELCMPRDGNEGGCSSTCLIELCGDGVLVPIEECDDENTDDGDGCNSLCELEYCGDGIPQTGLGEQCDDGNTEGGDGCDSDCWQEICGNGIVQFGETCDDGNTANGDGCSDVCQTVCGDRIVMEPEECDDGNAVSGDGCSDVCIIETGEWGDEVILSPTGTGNENFGLKVDIDGGYAIVGAYNESNPPSSSGMVYIFKKEGSGWNLLKKISQIEGVETLSSFGYAVAISGDYAVAADNTNVFVFYKDQGGEDNWGYQAQLVGSDGPFQFGPEETPVSISGDYIIVGSYNANGEQSNSGAAYVFYNDPNEGWSEQAKLTASDGAYDDSFGYSVSISGDYAIVGAERKYTQSYPYVGAAYIFKRDGVTWNQQAKITHGDQYGFDQFGWSVDISGEYAVIGTFGKQYGSYGQVGAAYVFKRTGGSWAQQAKLMAGDWSDSDFFGASVSISGRRAVIGARNKNSDKGAAYAFERNGTSWSQTEKFSINTVNSMWFGFSVSLDGLYTIIGAPLANNNRGTAYIYDFRPLICGDGYVRGEEECDDGNLTSGDGCTTSCLLEYCGDGINNNVGTEECDDGNSVDGDGCTSTCQLEICGDGELMGDEECDDGNNTSGDGCSSICEIENGQWNIGQKIYAADGQGGWQFGGNTNYGIGGAIDIDGNYAIVGAPNANGRQDNNEGAAYMFKKNGEGNWEQEFKVYANDGQNSQYFGTGVSISGDTAVVGSMRGDGRNYSSEGAAYIYKRTNELVVAGTAYGACDNGNDDEVSSVYFTGAPDLKNLVLTWTSASEGFEEFVGQSFDITQYDTGCWGTETNCVTLKDFNVTGGCHDPIINNWTFEIRRVWSHQAKVFALDGQNSDRFGTSVSVEGDYTAIGAPGNDLNKGAVYVFEKNSQPSLVLSGTAAEACDSSMSDQVSSEDLPVLSSQNLTGKVLTWTSGDFAWRSYNIMYQDDGCWNSDNCIGLEDFDITSDCPDDLVEGWTFEIHENWSQQDKFTAGSQGNVGWSVSMSGDRVLAGAPWESAQASGAGTAYIFKRDGSNWNTEATLTRSDPGTDDYFGWSVALEDNYAVIGAPFDNISGNEDKGSAYVFKKVGANWAQSAKLTTAGSPYDFVGWSVSLSGKRALVGAKGDSSHRGAAYIFERSGETWTEQEKFTAIDGVDNNLLGYSAAIDGVNAGIGAPTAKSITGNTGAAYMFAYKTVACGDGLLWGDEECDDGNLTNGDGCSSACQVEGYRFEYAGNGTTDDCDPIENNVCLWRDTSGPVYNVGQAGIEWACGQCSTAEDYMDLANLRWTCFGGGLANIPGHWTCLRVTDSDSHYNIYWTGWDSGDGQGGGSSGAFSYVRKIYDLLAPYAIDDLDVTDEGADLKLSWTAPADLGGGIVSRYVIRYSTSSINAGNWDSATTIYNSMIPAAPGDGESYSILKTFAPGTYYFAMRSYDDSGNLSGLSNVDPIALSGAKPVITNVTPSSGTNSAEVSITITGRNFVADIDKNYVHLINGSDWFSFRPYSATATRLQAYVPAGMAPGLYQVKVSNDTYGYSDVFADAYTSLPAALPPPVVTNVIPSRGTNTEDVPVEIYGMNLTGATAGSLRDKDGNTVALTDFAAVNDTKVTATVPSGADYAEYDVLITTPNGANAYSSQKYTVTTIYEIDENTTGNTSVDENGVLSLAGFTTEYTTLAGGVTLANTTARQATEKVLVSNITASIPAGTTITDGDDNPYRGQIDPPHLVSKEEALGSGVYDQLDNDYSVIFAMGNPDETINFSEDFVVSLSVSSDVQPVIWYYNQAEGKFELAGKDGVKDGVTYVPGGTLLNHIGNLYVVGILTDHMSSYVIGVVPAITDISPGSGAAGTAITITGTNFHPDAVVTIGGLPATATVDDTETITTTVPGTLSAGAKSVVVTNPDLTSDTGTFMVTIPPAAVCGNGACETGETSASCPADCGTAYVPPAGGGGGGGGVTREQLLKKKTLVTEEEEEAPVEPTVRPAAPTVSHVVTLIKSTFRDIINHWAEAYINRLYSENIVSGKTATKFAPNDPISRAEVVKIALNTFNYEIPSSLTYDPFPDVKMTDWVAPYAQVAREQGIIKGFPEGMRPNEYVSRAEALKILLAASKLSLESTSTKNFTDTSPSAWYMYYVRYAFENGIVQGHADGTFRPSATITRAEIAKITVKIMDLVMQ